MSCGRLGESEKGDENVLYRLLQEEREWSINTYCMVYLPKMKRTFLLHVLMLCRKFGLIPIKIGFFTIFLSCLKCPAIIIIITLTQVN